MIEMQLPPKIESEVFFTTHPVFTAQEYAAFLATRSGVKAVSVDARQTLLRHHLKRRRILRLRRGLYASVPAGQKPETYPVDPYLVAARLTADSVLAYHTALSLHGLAQSLREEVLTLSVETTSRSFRFRGTLYRTLPPPTALPRKEALSLGVETQDRQGTVLRVTGLERTLVDAFDRLALCGGWEEVWRSLEGLEMFLDFALLTRYVTLLGNATTAAKVGYFLESSQGRLHVPPAVLAAFKQRVPKQPHAVEQKYRGHSQRVPGWNLLIPTRQETASLAGDDAEEDIPV